MQKVQKEQVTGPGLVWVVEEGFSKDASLKLRMSG
jgi:hypothetical protein